MTTLQRWSTESWNTPPRSIYQKSRREWLADREARQNKAVEMKPMVELRRVA